MVASSLLLFFLLALHQADTLHAEDKDRYSNGRVEGGVGTPDAVPHAVRHPPTPPPAMISELEVKSDHELRKTLLRTTMAVRAYRAEQTTAAPPPLSPAPSPIQRAPPSLPSARGVIARPSVPPHTAHYTPQSIIQPLFPPPPLPQQSVAIPAAIPGGLNLYALVDPTSVRSANIVRSPPSVSDSQSLQTQQGRPRNTTSAQYEQLGCGWDLISQTCKDVFQIGWCQQCTDFGVSVFIHDCKCTTVTALYANTASALASAASSAFIASAVNHSRNGIPPPAGSHQPIFHPPQLATLQQPAAPTPPNIRSAHNQATQGSSEHQLIVVPVPVPVPVIAHPNNINAITALQHFSQAQQTATTLGAQQLTPYHLPPGAVVDNSAPVLFKASSPPSRAAQSQAHSSPHPRSAASSPVHVPTMWFN